MRAELRQRLHAALVVELATLSGDRSPHNLTRHPQAPRYPSDALAFDQIRTADPAYRLHGHHPGWPPLQPEEASADARVGQLLDADPKPSRSTIPRRSTVGAMPRPSTAVRSAGGGRSAHPERQEMPQKKA